MFAYDKPALLGNAVLAFLDFCIVEFFDAAALQANQMVVVARRLQFEYGLAGLEMVALEYPGLLELRENPVYRCEAHIQTFRHQSAIHVLGSKVAHRGVFEEFQDAQPGRGCLQPAGLQIVWTGSGQSERRVSR